MALGAAALVDEPQGADASDGEKRKPMVPSASDPAARVLPSIFLAHGSPLLLDDRRWVEELRVWAAAMPRPHAVLMISAHWVEKPVTLGAQRTVPLVYDFYGFPPPYYDVKYAAPGAPALAARVKELLAGKREVREEDRGLDHGAYVPLVAMYPEADVPVLQMSIPTMSAADLIALGRSLAPLRSEGVLVVGSGFLTHNMRALDWRSSAQPPSWAQEFDGWAKDVLERRDVDELSRYRERAPGVSDALPTHEHFVPVAVSLGASIDRAESVAFPIDGFTYGSFTKRSVQFG